MSKKRERKSILRALRQSRQAYMRAVNYGIAVNAELIQANTLLKAVKLRNYGEHKLEHWRVDAAWEDGCPYFEANAKSAGTDASEKTL